MIDAASLLFLGCLLILLAFSTKQDRAALWIVTISNFVGLLLVVFVTRQIHAPWKLVIPGAGETLTIIALLKWGQGTRSSFFQAVLLLVAWCAHFQCYADLIWNTNVVYDNYELVLGAVAIGQLLVCHDTIRHIVCSVVELFRFPRNRIIRPASVSANLLHSAGDSGVSNVP